MLFCWIKNTVFSPKYLVCSAGSFLNLNNNMTCELCPADKYSTTTNANGCIDCPSETVTQGLTGQKMQSSCGKYLQLGLYCKLKSKADLNNGIGGHYSITVLIWSSHHGFFSNGRNGLYKVLSLCRCNVLKQHLVISLHGSIFNVTNLPYPWTFRGEGLISSPLSLTLEPSTHDHHLPFYLFPLNHH